jgi:hypothetical protein
MTRNEIALKFLTSMLTQVPALQSGKNKTDIVIAAFEWADAYLIVRGLSEESLKDNIVVPLK